MSNSDLTIVIPTYKEKDNLAVLIPSLESTFKEAACDFQVLIIDDFSGDGTIESVKKLDGQYGNVKIISRNKKKDIASAWQEGFNLVKGRFIACMDGDLSHDPAYLINMYKEILQSGCDMVIGSRYLGGFYRDFQGKNFLARLTSASGQYLGRFITGLKQRDISHSFRIFKREVFETIKDKLTRKGNSYLVEFLYLVVKNNFSIREAPIVYRKRLYGRTKLKILKEGIRYIFNLVYIRCRKR